jgi:hypothetical protein
MEREIAALREECSIICSDCGHRQGLHSAYGLHCPTRGGFSSARFR